MIQEAYVSFETAMLLKEKGFPQNFILPVMYKGNGEQCFNPKSVVSWKLKYWYACPTQQMAVRWLREVHNLIITISPYQERDEESLSWYVEIVRYIDRDNMRNVKVMLWGFPYERAMEKSIKYCLENLI